MCYFAIRTFETLELWWDAAHVPVIAVAHFVRRFVVNIKLQKFKRIHSMLAAAALKWEGVTGYRHCRG